MRDIAKHPFITATIVMFILMIPALLQTIGPNMKVERSQDVTSNGRCVEQTYKIPRHINEDFDNEYEAIAAAKQLDPNLEAFTESPCRVQIKN